MNSAERLLREIRGGALPVAFVRGDHAEIADAMLARLSQNPGHRVGSENRIHCYNPSTGIWTAVPDQRIVKIVKSFAGSPKGAGTLFISAAAARGAQELAYAQVCEPEFFDQAASGVAFANGFAEVVAGTVHLRAHAPEHRARCGHNFDYDPNSKATQLLEFLDQVFADCSEEERAERISCLQEFAGACLVGLAPTYQKSLLLLGRGGNGKSQVASAVFRGALPDGTTTSLAPQIWALRFQLSRLIGALANVCDELPESDLINTGSFKATVAGEPVHMEEKYKPAFEQRLNAGHVFCANSLPATKDLSDGFFRRFVVINFGRRFDNSSACEHDIAKRIVSSCRPGIVAWALEGACRLQRQGRYTEPSSSDEAIADWKRSSNSVAEFVHECTDPEDGGGLGTRAKYLFRSYRYWCEESGYRAVSTKTFKNRLLTEGVWSTRDHGGVLYGLVAKGASEG